MSAAAPSMDPRASSEHDWVAAYEDLRRAALDEADGRGRPAPGVALLLRAGVVAWMQACRRVAAPVPFLPRGDETLRALPGTVRAEVATLLAQMALSAAVEIAP